MAFRSFFLALLLSLGVQLVHGVPAASSQYDTSIEKRAPNPYAPIKVYYNLKDFIRPATSVSYDEAKWALERKQKADAQIKKLLLEVEDKTGANFGKPKAPNKKESGYPVLALASSGGGFRALLTGAGVHQAFDGREKDKTSVSGLYQALSYESGLSGGAWLLGSIAANHWQPISSLKKNIWETTFQNGLLDPDGLGAPAAYAGIGASLGAKSAAGFKPTIVDLYGRLLGYALLSQVEGGVGDTFSQLATVDVFLQHEVPYPIMTALGVDGTHGQCTPTLNATQYEFSPYEFGSWDSGVSSFIPIKYLGSIGPHWGAEAIERYDNTGYIMGTSSNVFNAICNVTSPFIPAQITEALAAVPGHGELTQRDLYATYPNPFRSQDQSPLVATSKELTLIDGGEASSNDPIWPYLHRDKISVIFVNDNSADTSTNFPNGSEIHATYVQAQLKGLNRMPFIPTADVFVEKGYDKKPVFFGCEDDKVITIVYLPNTQYSYSSGTPTLKVQYGKAETDAMIANGVMVGTYGGNKEWPTCVMCAVMKKAGGSLPVPCEKCFEEFCYSG